MGYSTATSNTCSARPGHAAAFVSYGVPRKACPSAIRSSPSARPRESGCRLIALRQEHQPHKLQHPSDQVDNDRSEERPKPIQYRHIVDLQQNCDDPNGKEREKQNFAHAFEFGWGQTARAGEVDNGERDLTGYGDPAAPAPNGFGRRLYRQQENPEDRIGERKNGIIK